MMRPVVVLFVVPLSCRHLGCFGVLVLQTKPPGEGVENRKFPKVVRRGCKRSFGPKAQRSPKSLLHHLNPCFAPVQPQLAPVQEGFRSLGPKDLLVVCKKND